MLQMNRYIKTQKNRHDNTSRAQQFLKWTPIFFDMEKVISNYLRKNLLAQPSIHFEGSSGDNCNSLFELEKV